MGRRLVSASCWWDPAYGAAGRGDSSVVACVYTDDQGEYWLHGIRYLRHDSASPDDEATQLCRHVAAFVHDLHIPAVRLETNGIGRFLPGLLRREMAERQVPCVVVEAVSTRNKDIRIIEAFDAVLAAGALRAHRSVWETPFIAEMREWQPGMGGGATMAWMRYRGACWLSLRVFRAVLWPRRERSGALAQAVSGRSLTSRRK